MVLLALRIIFLHIESKISKLLLRHARLLFRDGLLPPKTHFFGYARSKLSIAELRKRCEPNISRAKDGSDAAKLNEFFEKRCSYVSGDYEKPEGFVTLSEQINANLGENTNRIFYLAVPPSVFEPITTNLHAHCEARSPAYTRIVIEKPFGRDLESSNALSAHLAAIFREEQMYRIDHYLGKEMVRSTFQFQLAAFCRFMLFSRHAYCNV